MRNRRWLQINWFSAGLVVGALVVVAIPVGGRGAEELAFPELRTADGHGNFCRVDDRGSYYLADLGDEIRTYAHFVAWCDARDGQIGWTN